LIEEVFGSKKRLSFEQFQEINMNVSSEMFLSIMLLLQSSIPCSENFNRYKRNYEKYLTSNPDSKDQPRSEVEVRMIASPRLMSKLKPFDQMNLVGGAQPDVLNFNPDSHKVLL